MSLSSCDDHDIIASEVGANNNNDDNVALSISANDKNAGAKSRYNEIEKIDGDDNDSELNNDQNYFNNINEFREYINFTIDLEMDNKQHLSDSDIIYHSDETLSRRKKWFRKRWRTGSMAFEPAINAVQVSSDDISSKSSSKGITDDDSVDISGSIESPKQVNSDTHRHNSFFPRENKASTKRKEWTVNAMATKSRQNSKQDEIYKTPLQRKETIIKHLKQELELTGKALSAKQEEVRALIESQKENTEIENSEICNDDTGETLEERHKELKNELEKIKKEFTEREHYHNEMYLKMYEKGKEAALIEREEEIEELAIKSPMKVATSELLTKLDHTQKELGRWQSIARQASYDGASKLDTDADAIVRFMKDSMYHYLTDEVDCNVHLRAMVRMLGFTEEERKKIVQIRKKHKMERL